MAHLPNTQSFEVELKNLGVQIDGVSRHIPVGP